MTRDQLLLAKDYYSTFPPGSWVQVPREMLLEGIATLEAAWAERDEGYGYLSRLLCSVTAPSPCQPLDTVFGVATQLDNYIAGLRRECDAYKFAAEQAIGMGAAKAIMDERDQLKHRVRELERDESICKVCGAAMTPIVFTCNKHP